MRKEWTLANGSMLKYQKITVIIHFYSKYHCFLKRQQIRHVYSKTSMQFFVCFLQPWFLWWMRSTWKRSTMAQPKRLWRSWKMWSKTFREDEERVRNEFFPKRWKGEKARRQALKCPKKISFFLFEVYTGEETLPRIPHEIHVRMLLEDGEWEKMEGPKTWLKLKLCVWEPCEQGAISIL